jgi:phospholipid/cholesterol/gamma-HCH transport system substrate-binding protein
MMKKALSKLSPKAFGALVLVLFLLVGWAAFEKSKIDTWLTFGHETIAAEFQNRAKLIGDDLTYDHTVKMNGVIVGKVTTLEQTDHGTMIAHMLVDPGIREKLGSTPSAFIIPTLVTDGVQYVGLETGGDPGQTFSGDMIPLERTRMPVYLDDVLKSVSSKQAIHGLQTFIGQSDATFRQGGSDAIRALVTDAPATLRPAGTVLNAVRGTNPDSDLTKLVEGFESFSQALNQQQGQFSSTVRSLDLTTQALAAGSRPLADAIASGPDTLRVSRAGLADLRPALHKLKDTSEDFRPSARKLDDFLQEFGPVIHRARPVFHDLRDVLEDARPLLKRLVPTADHGTQVVDDVKGRVLDRVNGPIKDRIYSPYVGKNEYKGDDIPYPTYKEVGYFISAFSSVFQHYDANNAVARLAAGAGGQSAFFTKFPKTVEEYMESLGFNQPPGPNPSEKGPFGSVAPGKADPKRDVPQLTGKNTDMPMLGGSR